MCSFLCSTASLGLSQAFIASWKATVAVGVTKMLWIESLLLYVTVLLIWDGTVIVLSLPFRIEQIGCAVAQADAGFLLRNPGFNPGWLCVRLLVEQGFSSEFLRFLCQSKIHHCSTSTHTSRWGVRKRLAGSSLSWGFYLCLGPWLVI